jgi:hypothetical protein
LEFLPARLAHQPGSDIILTKAVVRHATLPSQIGPFVRSRIEGDMSVRLFVK